MRIEVDQSGRIGDTQVPTVLAFSDGERFSIVIPAVVKRECLGELRARGLKGPSLYVLLFATGLYLLLKDHLSKDTEVIVDRELEGHEASVKEHLLNLLKRGGVSVYPDQVSFARVGKRSPAHALAIETYRGKLTASREVGAEEILEEFQE